MANTSKSASGANSVTIKKYANRRLYNTATSSYVTLDHLCQMVKDGQEFQVFDAKTGDDITRSVLAQIIFEEEAKGHNLLPIRFLRQLIQFYDNTLQSVVPRYLEVSMESFARNQAQFQRSVEEALGSRPELKPLEEVAQKNFALFDKALRRIAPAIAEQRDEEYEALTHQQDDTLAAEPVVDAPAQSTARDDQIDALQKQIAEMQKQLAELAAKK